MTIIKVYYKTTLKEENKEGGIKKQQKESPWTTKLFSWRKLSWASLVEPRKEKLKLAEEKSWTWDFNIGFLSMLQEIGLKA